MKSYKEMYGGSDLSYKKMYQIIKNRSKNQRPEESEMKDLYDDGMLKSMMKCVTPERYKELYFQSKGGIQVGGIQVGGMMMPEYMCQYCRQMLPKYHGYDDLMGKPGDMAMPMGQMDQNYGGYGLPRYNVPGYDMVKPMTRPCNYGGQMNPWNEFRRKYPRCPDYTQIMDKAAEMTKPVKKRAKAKAKAKAKPKAKPKAKAKLTPWLKFSSKLKEGQVKKYKDNLYARVRGRIIKDK